MNQRLDLIQRRSRGCAHAQAALVDRQTNGASFGAA